MIAAGNTWRWDKVVADHRPADGWALKYAFRSVATLVAYVADVTKLDYTAAADPTGGFWQITIPKTGASPKTDTLTPGSYRWQAYVEKGAERYTIDEGELEVEPNFETAVFGQLASHAEKTLTVIEAALEGRLSSDMESYQILGRAVSKIPIEVLSKLRGKYRAMVQRERNPTQLGRKVEMIFAQPR